MTTESRRDIFQAIADPTRRKIINLIARQPLTLGAVAEHFKISRPAISQQIKVLNECGIVDVKRDGRETFCSIRPAEIKKIADWAAQYQHLWEDRIDRFEAYLTQLHTEKKQKNGKSKRNR